MKFYLLFISCILGSHLHAQLVKGVVKDDFGMGIPGALVQNLNQDQQVLTDVNGLFAIRAQVGDSLKFAFRNYTVEYLVLNQQHVDKGIAVSLFSTSKELEEVNVVNKRLAKFDVGTMPPIKGVQITTGTNAIIELENLSGAKAAANPREMFAKIPGLNIWESDGAGIQIGIGGRGLSPNRAANFNTRQNGYDISADALGYPESYYTPPFEALKAVEITRGSASLQFGTQFGGLLNFIIKDPAASTPLEFTSRNTVGSYGLGTTFNRLSGSHNKWGYQVYHQYKFGNGYRDNSTFDQQQAFAQLSYFINEKMKVKLEATHMDYLAQQAGGLTDVQFDLDPRKSYRDRNWFKVNWDMLALHYDYEINAKALFNVRAFGINSSRESLGFLGKISQADPGGNREMISGEFLNGGVEARYLQRYTISETKEIKGAFLLGGRAYKGFTTSKQGMASDASDADFRFLNPNDLENSNFSFPSKNLAAFAENILFCKKLTFNFGMRYEYLLSSAEGFYKRYSIHPLNMDTLGIYTTYDSNRVERSLPLFGAGMSYKINAASTIYTNFTQNYRAVNFTDIRVTNPNVVVDTLINDEHGFTAELGFRGFKNKLLVYDLALFTVFYGDKIGLAPKPGTALKERTNIGNALNLGVEAFVEIDLISIFKDSAKYSFNLFVNAAYIDARYVSSKEPNYVGKQVEYVSPLLVKSGVKFSSNKFTAQIQGSYNSEQYADASNSVVPTGDAVIGLIPSYLVFDFSSRYKLNSVFQVEAGVLNFTNQKYFTRRATAYPGPGILPSDGITVYGTLQIQLSVKRK